MSYTDVPPGYNVAPAAGKGPPANGKGERIYPYSPMGVAQGAYNLVAGAGQGLVDLAKQGFQAGSELQKPPSLQDPNVVGQAGVQGALLGTPVSPAMGTAVRGAADPGVLQQGQDAVERAVAPPQAPPGAPPPGVAQELDSTLGSAASRGPPKVDIESQVAKYQASLKNSGLGAKEQGALVTEYRRLLQQHANDLDTLGAVQSAAQPGEADAARAAAAGQGAVQDALKAPGWIRGGPPEAAPVAPPQPVSPPVAPAEAAPAPAVPKPNMMGDQSTSILTPIIPHLVSHVATAFLPPGVRSIARAALKPAVANWLRNVDTAAALPVTSRGAQLKPLAATIDKVAGGDKATAALLSKIILLANAPGPDPSSGPPSP